MTEINTNTLPINTNELEQEIIENIDKQTNETKLNTSDENIKVDNNVDKQINSLLKEDIKNQTKEVTVAEKSKINEITDEISTTINAKDNKKNIKLIEPFSEEITKLLDSYKEIANLYENTASREEKLQCMDKINSIVNQTEKSLIELDPKDEKSQILFTLLDKIDDHLLEVADEAKKLSDFTDLLKSINLNQDLSNKDKLAQLQEIFDQIRKEDYIFNSDYEVRIQMLRESVSAIADENIELDKFFKGMQVSDEDKSNTKQAACKILSSLMLNLSSHETREVGFNLSSLYGAFKKYNKENLSSKNENEQKLEFIRLMTDLSKATDANKICSLTDKLLNNYSGDLSRDIKESLTTPKDYNYVEVQHTYQSAFNNLIKSLPKDVQTSMTGKQFIDVNVLNAIKNNSKAFADIKFQLASMLLMQYQLTAYNGFELTNETGTKLDVNEALSLCIEIANEADVTQIYNELSEKLNKSKEGELINVDLTEVKGTIINSVKKLSDKYDLLNIKGDLQERSHIKVVKNSADKLANGILSNKNAQLIYDTDHNTKCLRVFDNVLKQLSGELDVEKRGMLSGDSTANQLKSQNNKTSELFNNIQKGIRNSLIVHSRFLDNADKETIKLMNSLISINNKDEQQKFKENFMTAIGNKISTDKLTYNDIDIRLKGLRKEFANCYNIMTQFAKDNGECLQAHKLKKEVNQAYKQQEAIYNKLTWVWPTQRKARQQNIDTIILLGKNRDRINQITQQIEKATTDKNVLLNIKDLENEKTHLIKENTDKFELLKNVSLNDLVSLDKKKNAKEELGIDEYLDQALPLANAFEYFSNGEAKKTKELIKDLKTQRNALRKNLNNYLNLGKKAFGEGTIAQLQRAIMLAVYISSKDNESEQANAYSINGRSKIDNILKNDLGIDVSNEFMNALVSDTIRRYTDPNGNITPKYISIIEKKLCKESQIVTDTEYLMDQASLDALDSKAMRAYKQKGTQALLNLVDKEGQSFTYNRHEGIKVTATAYIASTSLSGKADDSMAVTNVGKNGFVVTLKSEKCVQLVEKLTLLKIVDTAEVALSISGAYKNVEGLKFNFKNKNDLDAFLKDFMDNKSSLHNDQNYIPQWIKSCKISTINGYGLEGGLSCSAQIGLAAIKEIKDYETEKVNINYKLPEIKTSIGGQVQYNTVTEQKGDISLRSSKFQAQLKIEAEASTGTLNITNKNYENLRNTVILNTAEKFGLIEKMGQIAQPFVEPLLETLYETATSDAGKEFLKTCKKNLENEIKNNPNESFKKSLLKASKDAFEKNKDALLKEVLKDFVHQETDNDLVKYSQFTLEAYLDYKTLHDGVNLAKTLGLNPGNYKFVAKLDINNSIGTAVKLLKDYMMLDTSDPNEEVTFLKNFVNGVKKSATVIGIGIKTLSTINELLDGDPITVLSNIASFIPEKEHSYKSQYGNLQAKLGGEKVIEINGSERSAHTEISGSLSVKEGVKFKSTFGTIIETLSTEGYDNKHKVYTKDTGIQQTLAKAQFSLENALHTLNLPKSFWEKYQNNVNFQKEIKDTFEKAQPTDTIVANYRISDEMLKQLNKLEKQRELEKETAKLKSLDKEINKIISNKDNYVINSLDINTSKINNLKTALDIFGNLDLGILAFEYSRNFVQAYNHSFNLNTLKETTNDTRNNSKASKIAFRKKQFFKQTPRSNTCFFMSVINSLSETDKGLALLSRTITDQGISCKNKVYPIEAGSNRLSSLERTMATVYQKEVDQTYMPFAFGEAHSVATSIFGLSYVTGTQYTKPDTNDELWNKLKDNVNKNDVTILHNPNEMHYIAIIEAKTDEHGNKIVKIKDSTDNTEKYVPYSDICKKNNTIMHYKID